MTETQPAPMRLVITCPDRPGIVAATAQFLYDNGANVVRSDQYSGLADDTFFLRMEFTLPVQRRDGFGEQFGLRVAERFKMSWRLWDSATPKKITVFVSRDGHCLHELLYRWRQGELGGEIVSVISNWEDQRELVEGHGIAYHCVPVDAHDKSSAERAQLELAKDSDLIVLARYMQILSADFLDRLGVPVINIHHSFLPAFEGANPYARAKARGVKLVGATAHYVTPELDAGPIIEQDVVRVKHSDTVDELVRMGSEVERLVLARAVAWHCQDRVIRYGNTTVVF